MKIDYLEIRSRFKNLEKVKIDFDENNLMTVIVGRNGSGKSNVLEALVIIFRNLDLGEPPIFSYEIKYRLGTGDDERWIIIDADHERETLSKQYIVKSYFINKPEESANIIPIAKVKRDKDGNSFYLPKHVFAYYSGPSDRLENYFSKHRTDFYRKLLRNEIDLKGNIRPLFYAKPMHSQFVLLAFYMNEKNSFEKDFLKDNLGIEELDSVHFVMRKPEWTNSKQKNELFWGASGVVRDFINRLFPLALAPIKIERQEDTTLTGATIKNEFFHLFLPDVNALGKAAKSLTEDVFFKMLESTLLSKILLEVRIRVKVVSSKEPLTFRELSEGEQQLLTVLGLLKFTGGSDSLFLLDEPDTHLNPSWSMKYLEFLRKFVPNHKTSHLLMVTHHPLTIAELKKEQVQVMWRDEKYKIHSQQPADNPQGLGFAGILTSDMFGLRSTLDNATEDLLRQKYSIIEKEKITDEDRNDLDKLDRDLDSLGFTTSHWDNQYQEYIKLKKDLLPMEEEINPEDLKKRKQKAREIIQRIINKDKMEATDETSKV